MQQERQNSLINVSGAERILKEVFSPNISGLSGVTTHSQSAVFSFTSSGNDFIIKFSTERYGLLKDKYAQEHFSNSSVPIPQTLLSGTLGPNLHFNVVERAKGDAINRFKKADAKSLLPTIANALKSIHEQSPSNICYGVIDVNGVAKYNSWVQYLLAQIASLKNSKFLVEFFSSQNAFFEMLEQLEIRQSSVETYCRLLHGDYHWKNIISDGSSITGIIDWDLAMWGDPVFDISRLYYCADDWYEEYVASACKEIYGSARSFEYRLISYRVQRGLTSLHYWSKKGEKSRCKFVLNKLRTALQKAEMPL